MTAPALSPPTALITLIPDDTTPSGVRLRPLDGSTAWGIRYQTRGVDHRQHLAISLLDLVAQNTPGAASLNGRDVVRDAHLRLLEDILGFVYLYGHHKQQMLAQLENKFNIVLAEFNPKWI